MAVDRKLYVLDWLGAVAVAQPKLNQAMLNKIPIPFPSFEEQKTIVRQLDALRAETQKLEALYQKKTADLEELKKSILQKAFSGELTGGRLRYELHDLEAS